MLPRRVEWPTVVVAVVIWGGFAAVLVGHRWLPPVAQVVALAVLAAWYGSLEHEVIHGHPTPWRSVNRAIVALPLGLVVPFDHYRRSHLEHHRSPELTDPVVDPESFYVTAETWARCGPGRRAVLWVLRTLAGRIVLGPLVVAWRNGAALLDGLRATGHRRRGAVAHVVGVAVVLVAVAASGTSVLLYVLAVGWAGSGLSLVRSFVEHRWTSSGSRAAVVRSGPAMSLLFLNNNLHHTHHLRPGVAWYELPALHRRLDGDGAAAAGAGLYRGYLTVARHHLVRPFDTPVLPALTPTASPSPIDGSAAATAQPAPAV